MVSTTNLDSTPVAILTGPTATGKTSLALELAENHGQMEIINADSLLIYRKMDIGTAKPSRDELARVPHHLIDIRDPNQDFNAGDFVRACEMALRKIHASGKRAMIVGGTGFYLKALLYGMWDAPPSNADVRKGLEAKTNEELFRILQEKDLITSRRIELNDRYRLIRANEILEISGRAPSEIQNRHRAKESNSRYRLWVIDRDSAELEARIRQRTLAMLASGLVDEVKGLRSKYGTDLRPLKSVGYAQVCHFLDGIAPEGRKLIPGTVGLTQEIELATRQLVKRQRTWFRSQKNAERFFLEEEVDRLRWRFAEIYA